MNDYTVIDFLINAVLAIIMFGVGLSLTTKHFRNIFYHPKAIIVGLSSQIIALPFLAYLIAYFSGLSPAMQVGIVIISACPGGASSNLITYLLKGNVALSISMTTLNSFITLVSVPLIVNGALWVFVGETSSIRLPVGLTVLQIFSITIVPAALGVLVRNRFPVASNKIEKPLKYVLPLLLGTVFAIKLFAGKQSGGSGLLLSEILQLLPFVLLLNFVGMFLGYNVARLMSLGNISRLTISIEVGLQNTALALLIAGTLLKNSEMEKPALVYAMFTFFLTVLFGYTVKKMSRLEDIIKR